MLWAWACVPNGLLVGGCSSVSHLHHAGRHPEGVRSQGRDLEEVECYVGRPSQHPLYGNDPSRGPTEIGDRLADRYRGSSGRPTDSSHSRTQRHGNGRQVVKLHDVDPMVHGATSTSGTMMTSGPSVAPAVAVGGAATIPALQGRR